MRLRTLCPFARSTPWNFKTGFDEVKRQGILSKGVTGVHMTGQASKEDRSEALEELRSWIGREQHNVGVDEVSRNDIRRKLEVYCFDCPLYTDDDIARAHGYRMAVAPSAMIPLWTMPAYWRPGDPPLFSPGKAQRDGGTNMAVPKVYSSTVNAASEVEYYDSVYPGDRLQSVVKLTDVKERETRLGIGAFLTFETRIERLSGELVALRRNTSFQYDKRTEGGSGARDKEDSSSAEIAGSDAVENVDIDWSRQITWDEVQVGDELPSYNLWLNYQRIVMSVATDRMFSGIHHDRDYAHAQGLDDIIFNTRGYEYMLEIFLRRWIGLDGQLRKFGPFRMVSNGHPGDTLVCGARVSSTEVKDGAGLVELELWVDSPRRRAAQGEAVVSLPLVTETPSEHKG